MNKKNFNLFSKLFISLIILTAIVFFASLAFEYNKGKINTQQRFTSLTRNFVDALSGKINFTEVLGETDDLFIVTLNKDSSTIFSFPKNQTNLSTNSVFIKSFNTSIIDSSDTEYKLTASIYMLKPSSILFKCKITFICILVIIIISIITLVIMSSEINKEDQDESIFEIEENNESINDFNSNNDFDNINTNVSILTNDSINTDKDLNEVHINLSEASNTETQKIADSLVSQVNNNMQSYDDNQNGLFSPSTGFGWETFLLTRLDSELVRCASSEQDLALFTVRIPCIDWMNPASESIKKLIQETFKFKDLIFEYKDDGFYAILENINIDTAIEIADKFNIEVTSLLAQAGLELMICIGISCRSLRLISGTRLLKESEQALMHALEEKDSPVVAFRVNPKKYREYLASENSNLHNV